MADPGFSRGGAPIPKLGLFCQFFAENCMKMKEFGPPGGGRASLAPPLDPPMTCISERKSSLEDNFAGSFRVSLFIDLGCPRDLGKGWRGDLGTFMISRPIKLKSDWLKLSIWNGVMGKYPIRFCYYCGIFHLGKLWAKFGQTSGQVWANFRPSSGKLRPNFGPSSGKVQAKFRQTLGKLQAKFRQTLGKLQTNFGQSSLAGSLLATVCF